MSAGTEERRKPMQLVALGAAVGIPAALLAALFLALVHQTEHWLWTDLPHDLGDSKPPWYLVIFLPVVGACVVVAARKLLPGDGGEQPLKGFGHADLKISYAAGIVLAALGTLAFGAVLGPEAPLIAIGSIAGLTMGSIAGVGPKQSAVLGAAGSFSAISALFGGPIVGGLILLESGLAMGAALIPVLIPGFVAAALGYVLFLGLGNWGGLNSQAITLPGLPPYHETVGGLVAGVLVGVAVALVITQVRQRAADLERVGPGRIGMPGLLLAGGLAVGLVAQIAGWLGANTQDVLFSGQSSVPALVATGSTKILLILIVAKAIGYGISLGCGFRGGPIFPAIFLGVAVAMLPSIWFGISPTWAVAVGAAAGMSATSKLILTPIVFASLLTGLPGTGAVSAAVLAAVAAWLTVTALTAAQSKSA